MKIDTSVDFDISLIDESQLTLRAAVQTVCWSYGQAGISAAKTLADAGLMEERHHLMIMDELWQSLRASELLVHQIDSITRLNRTKGLGQLMITHSMKDLQLSTDELTKIATGFVERSSIKILGGLAQNEMALLETVFPVSEKEKSMLVGWSAEGSMNPNTNKVSPPPGRGRFMLKTGSEPGVPFRVHLTAGELRAHNTNKAWAAAQAKVNQ